MAESIEMAEIRAGFIRSLRVWLYYAEPEEKLAAARICISSADLTDAKKDEILGRIIDLIDEIKTIKENNRWQKIL